MIQYEYRYELGPLASQIEEASDEEARELLAEDSARQISAEEMAKIALASLSKANFQRVEMLVDAGADVNALMPNGEALGLQILLERKAADSLREKITARIRPESSPSGPNGETLLMAAAALGSADLTNKLLAAGHDPRAKLLARSPNLRAPRGATALMIATTNPSKAKEVMELLIPVSDLSAKDISGNTALACACDQANIAAIKLLLPISDIRARDDQQKTLLIKAVASGSIEAVKLILPKAKARARNDRRQSALMIAARDGSWEMVEELLPKSALAAVDEKGQTALVHAIVSPIARQEEDVAIKLLPMSPLTVGTADTITKRNLLMLAASAGKARIASELLAHFDPLAADMFGETALMIAASGRSDSGFEVVKLLLPLSNEDAVSTDGYSAAWFAERSRSARCLALIKASSLAKKEARIFAQTAEESLAPSRKKPFL